MDNLIQGVNMIDEQVKAIGQLTIVKTDGITGETTTTVTPNMIVTLGKQYIAGRLKQTPQAVMTCMAIGTGTVAADLADTQLGTEVLATAYNNGVSRPLLTSPDNPSQAGAVLKYVCTFGTSTTPGTYAITEAGIFDNVTRAAGTMMARTVFGVVTKTASDTITISWSLTIS